MPFQLQQILTRIYRIFRRALIPVIALSAIGVVGIALLPVLTPRSPFGDDPFHYLHEPQLQPLYSGWITYNNWQARKGIVKGEAIQRAMAAYTDALSKQTAINVDFDFGIQGVSDLEHPKCISLRFTNAQAAVGRISFSTFEKDPGPVCRYFPNSAKFSDDRSELTVEVKTYTNDFPSTLWVYTVDSAGKAHLARTVELAELLAPNAYLANGSLVYKPQLGQVGKDWDAKCALVADKSGQPSCLVSEAAMGQKRRIQAFHRLRGANHIGIVLARASRKEVDAFYFPEGAPLEFGKPSALHVDDFALLQKGFVFSRNEPTKTRYESVQRYYRQMDAQTTPTLMLEVPFYKSSFMNSGAVAYVMHRHKGNGTYALTRLSDSGVEDVPLGIDVKDTAHISLVTSETADLPAISVRTLQREVFIGNVVPGRGFVQKESLIPGIPLKDTEFEARSADGTMVPCNFVAPLNAKLPIPAVAVVYGAYGVRQSTLISPPRAAVLANQIGYLFAHARGGGERGREWHADGRIGLKKMKTGEDFEACIDEGWRRGYLAQGKVLVYGGSAGAIPALNTALRRPDMVAGARLNVPYVDSSGRADNTLGDDLEFGNLAIDKEAAERKQMSPYDRLSMPSDQGGRFFFTCGEYDKLIEPWHCMKVDAAIRALHPNKQSQFMVVADEGHSSVYSLSETNLRDLEIILSFILATLQPGP